MAIGVALVAGVLGSSGWPRSTSSSSSSSRCILASGLQPIIAWLRGHAPLGRGPAILLVYGLFLAVVVGMAVVVVPAALTQFERDTRRPAAVLRRARDWAATLRPTGLSASLDRPDRRRGPDAPAATASPASRPGRPGRA